MDKNSSQRTGTQERIHHAWSAENSQAPAVNPNLIPTDQKVLLAPPALDFFLHSLTFILNKAASFSPAPWFISRITYLCYQNRQELIFSTQDFIFGLRIISDYCASGGELSEVVIMASVMLGHKVLCDVPYDNPTWGLLWKIEAKALSEAEIHVLNQLNFELNSDPFPVTLDELMVQTRNKNAQKPS